jgi:hypothetical protein
MTNRRVSESITIASSPETLYDMVSDVTRMGEWSPVCKACWWDDDTRGEGAWFTGRNITEEKTWETRSKVVADEPGREFAFAVNGDRTRWGYTFEPADGGTVVTESWEILPAAEPTYPERFGDDAEAEIARRADNASNGMRETLAALKRVAESARPESA